MIPLSIDKLGWSVNIRSNNEEFGKGGVGSVIYSCKYTDVNHIQLLKIQYLIKGLIFTPSLVVISPNHNDFDLTLKSPIQTLKFKENFWHNSGFY